MRRVRFNRFDESAIHFEERHGYRGTRASDVVLEALGDGVEVLGHPDLLLNFKRSGIDASTNLFSQKGCVRHAGGKNSGSFLQVHREE